MSQGFNPPPNPLPISMGGTGNSIGPGLGIVTVATLPAAGSHTGIMMLVTDGLAPALGAIVTGGGAVTVLVVSNGTNWLVV